MGGYGQACSEAFVTEAKGSRVNTLLATLLACEILPVTGGSIVDDNRGERLPSVKAQSAVEGGTVGTGEK